MNERPPLILASASPRRAQLLRDAGYNFQQYEPPFDDSDVPLDQSPEVLATRLARRKADSIAHRFEGAGAIVIGCDTLLSVEGRAVGKPADAQEARRILRQLFAAPHRVVTAVCLIDAHTHRETAFTDTTEVSIAPPSEDQFERYLSSGEWRGKAGGYNLAQLQDRWRFEIKGDPTTVIGLPMRRLADELRRVAPYLLPNS